MGLGMYKDTVCLGVKTSKVHMKIRDFVDSLKPKQ